VQLLASNEVAVLTDQVGEQAKRLIGQQHPAAVAPQFTRLPIQFELFEPYDVRVRQGSGHG
jgi:hypothetical protein